MYTSEDPAPSVLRRVSSQLWEVPGDRSRRRVLCIPGICGDGRVFDPLAVELRGERELLAVDLPPGDVFAGARAISWVLRERTRAAVHVVTGSYGGLVALCLPPEQVASLALIGTVPSRRFVPPWIGLVAHLLGRLPDEWVERRYLEHLRGTLTADEVPAALRDVILSRRVPASELVERLRSVRSIEAPHSRVPTTFLAGTDDGQIRWAESDVTRARPGVAVATVRGAHRPYASHPSELLAWLSTWWAEHETKEVEGGRAGGGHGIRKGESD